MVNTIEMNSGQTKSQLNDTCNALNERKRRIQKEMRAIARTLRFEEDIDYNLLAKYQKLNTDLKNTKIMEAEFCYTKHML